MTTDNHLSPRQKHACRLRREGMTYEQIGARMGIVKSAVLRLLRRARKQTVIATETGVEGLTLQQIRNARALHSPVADAALDGNITDYLLERFDKGERF